MLIYTIIFTLALLVLIAIKTTGIDQPSLDYKESYAAEVSNASYFTLPRGQPSRLWASIITNKSPPRNKGKPGYNTS